MTTTQVSHRAGTAWWLALFAMGAVFLGTRAGAGGAPVALEPFLEAGNTTPDVGGRAPAPALLQPPAHLVIPTLDIRATVRGVALDAKGALITPPATDAGWYELGPAPGARGSSVIVGHVDSRTAPGVFAELSKLRPGDLVGVRDTGGVWTVFGVRNLSQHPKDALPPDLWAPTRARVLRLITCGGSFDARTGHYRDNVVAHAEALGRWRPPASDPGREPPWDRLGMGR